MVKRIIFAGIAAISALSLFAGAAFAASPNQSEPGTPGTPDCFGQTVAFVTQGGLTGINGIGPNAQYFDLTNQQFKAVGEDYCAA